ncbi:MAG TPA: riboflavin synthase [Thermoanaerobaculia bacterium]|nr:riboflavin synthase [Thermoanaerobaculia bacterium]
MFTGLIQQTGRVRAFERIGDGARLTVATDGVSGWKRGESVAINGVCLTVFPASDSFAADLSAETLSLTTLANLAEGTIVNVERAMTLSDRLGGHLVQGHVDATGTLLSVDASGDFAEYRWSYPAEHQYLLVSKGSIAVDGVSLTVVGPDQHSFGAALIPETLARTNLGSANVGDPVNLEFDIIAKYAARMLRAYLPTQ